MILHADQGCQFSDHLEVNIELRIPTPSYNKIKTSSQKINHINTNKNPVQKPANHINSGTIDIATALRTRYKMERQYHCKPENINLKEQLLHKSAFEDH